MSFFEKISDELGAVMLRDTVNNLLGQIDLSRHLDPLLDVGGDDERAHAGR